MRVAQLFVGQPAHWFTEWHKAGGLNGQWECSMLQVRFILFSSSEDLSDKPVQLFLAKLLRPFKSVAKGWDEMAMRWRQAASLSYLLRGA
jgi:hypothetical protein